MRKLVSVVLIFAMLGIIICDEGEQKMNTSGNIRIDNSEHELETMNIAFEKTEIVYFPLIAIISELGISCQRQKGTCVLWHNEKEYLLMMDKSNIKLYAIDTPNVNLLLLPPGSSGGPFYYEDDIYVNLSTLSHVLRQMGIEVLISVDDNNIYYFHLKLQ